MEMTDNKTSKNKQLLLRTLGVSEERIAALEAGTADLSEVMQERITESINDPNDTTQCAIICQNIKFDGCSYESLDADIYWERIKEMKARGGTFKDIPLSSFSDILTKSTASTNENTDESTTTKEAPTQDKNQADFNKSLGINFGITIGSDDKVQAVSIYAHPLRRFIARGLDEILCLLVVNLVYRLIIGIDPYMYTMSGNSAASAWVYIIYLLMLAVEPLALSAFGTTPGKYLLGIRILAPNGKKLTIKQAYLRSLRLWHHGFGFLIPFYNLIRMSIACSACRRGLPMPWDYGTLILNKEDKMAGRIIGILAIIFSLSFVDASLSAIIGMPPNKGLITEAEFYENSSYIYRYNAFNVSNPLTYDIETDASGYVSKVSFTVNLQDEETIEDYYTQMYIPFIALAGASDSANIMDFAMGGISPDITAVFSNTFSTFSFNYGGYTISNKVDYTGYARNIIYGYMYKTGTDEHRYHQEFSISR